MPKNNESILTGIAGVYYAAAELTKKGYNASILLNNSEIYDILAVDQTNHQQLLIQVKTTWDYRGGRKWILNKKVEDFYNENFFYIFINLFNEDKRPEFFIIHSKELAKKIKNGHQSWLETPGRKGQKHNENSMRQFSDKEGVYLEKWEHLKMTNKE